MKYLFTIIAFLLVSNNVYSGEEGYLAKAVKIKKMSSTTSNSDAFWINVGSGGGDCAGAKIKFKKSNTTPGTDVFNTAYASALTAITTHSYINVFSYTNGKDCSSAVSIELCKDASACQ